MMCLKHCVSHVSDDGGFRSAHDDFHSEKNYVHPFCWLRNYQLSKKITSVFKETFIMTTIQKFIYFFESTNNVHFMECSTEKQVGFKYLLIFLPSNSLV